MTDITFHIENPWKHRDDIVMEEIPIAISPQYIEVMTVQFSQMKMI